MMDDYYEERYKILSKMAETMLSSGITKASEQMSILHHYFDFAPHVLYTEMKYYSNHIPGSMVDRLKLLQIYSDYRD